MARKNGTTKRRQREPLVAARAVSYAAPQGEVTPAFTGPSEVVCRLSRIVGFEKDGDRASAVVGADTRKLAEVKIHFIARRDDIYAHSNFVVEGCVFATKLVTNQKHPLETLVGNLVATPEQLQSDYFTSNLRRAIVHDFEYIVDEEVLLNTRYNFLNFEGLERISVLHQGSLNRIPLAVWRQQRSASEESEGISSARRPDHADPLEGDAPLLRRIERWLERQAQLHGRFWLVLGALLTLLLGFLAL